MGNSSNSILRLPEGSYAASQFNPSQALDWERIDSLWANLHVNRQPHTKFFKTEKDPPATLLTFSCPRCSAFLYDGGLEKKRKCKCGAIWMRADNGSVTPAAPNDPGAFCSLFEEVNSLADPTQVQPLCSLTLGVFQTEELEAFQVGGVLQLRALFAHTLGPFAQQRRRCLGIGDYFAVKGVKFKVIGCFPSFGVVTASTVFTCTEQFSTTPLQSMRVKPIGTSPHPQFAIRLRTHLHKRPRHVHQGQYLFIGGQECLVVEASPLEGVTSPQTEVGVNESLPTCDYAELVPVSDDLPVSVQFMWRSRLQEEVATRYFLPFLQGFRRRLAKAEFVAIDGVQFLVNECVPAEGVTHENTLVYYQGSIINRHEGQVRRQGLDLTQLLTLVQMQAQNREVWGQVAGMDARQLAKLPSHLFSGMPENPEARTCLICMAEFQQDEVARTLPCLHLFHQECVAPWLQQCILCPLCKYNVVDPAAFA